MPKLPENWCHPVAAAAALLLLVACSSAETRLREHLQLADKYYEQADYQKARLEYQNALKIDEKNADAHYRLGKTMEQLQDVRSVVANYGRAVELDPKHVDARVHLAYVYLAVKAKDEARRLDDEGLALNPEHPELIALRGNIRLMEGDTAGALADGEAALARDAASIQAARLLAFLYARQGQQDKAIVMLRQGVERNPDSIPLQVILVNAYVEHGDNDAALGLYRKLIERQPENLNHRLQLARFHVRLKQSDEAEQVLRDAVRAIPASIPAKAALVDFLYDVRGQDRAEQELLGIIESDPKELQLRSALASLYEKEREFDKARVVYQTVIDLDPKGDEGVKSRTRLARLLYGEGKRDDAANLLLAALKISPNDIEALTFRGQTALERGDAASAIADFRSVLKEQPDSVPLLRLLARAHATNNEAALARDEMRKAVELDAGNPQLRLEMAQLDLQAGDGASAREQLARVLAAAPNQPEALAAVFRLSLAEKDLKAAHEYAGRFKAAYPGNALGYYFAGQAYQAENRLAQSEQEYETALAKSSPAEIQPLAGLVAVHLLRGERDKALARVERALATAPKIPLLYNMKGELLLGGKQFDAAQAVFGQAIELDPKFAPAYRNLVLASLAKGDKDGAVAVYRKGMASNPGNPVLLTQLASLYEGLGRFDEAIGLYRETLQNEPGSLMAVNNLAMLLASYRDDKDSLDEAGRLAARLANLDNPNYLDTIGWVNYKRGDVATAISVLEQAVAKAPDSPILLYHLGKVYHVKGDNVQARVNLEKALQRPEPFSGKDDARAILTALADS